MGKRGRVQKKYRQKYSLQVTMHDPSSDKNNLVPESIHINTQNFSDNSQSDLNVSINDSPNCTPEFALFENRKVGYYNNMSPKMNTPLHNIKLNLDIPENDHTNNTEKRNNSKIVEEKNDSESSKDLEKTLSVEKIFEREIEEAKRSSLKANEFTNYSSLNLKTNSELMDMPRKELTSLSGYFEIPSSTFNLPVSVPAVASNYVFVSRSLQNDWVKENVDLEKSGCYINEQFSKSRSDFEDNCLLPNITYKTSFSEGYCIKIDSKEELENTNSKAVLNIYRDKNWDSTLGNGTCVDLPLISDVSIKTTGIESQIITVPNYFSDIPKFTLKKQRNVYSQKLKRPWIKITTFCNWFAKKFVAWIKKGYKGIEHLLSVTIALLNPPPFIESELMQVIAVVRCENERILSALSEKISSLSQDLNKIRNSNEVSLQALINQLNKVQTANSQLTKINDNLLKELKTIQEKIQEVKSVSLVKSTAMVKHPRLEISSTPSLLPCPCNMTLKHGFSALPPPPPPLPPPSLLYISKLNCTDSTTPQNKNNSALVTNVTTPSTSRPAITVEDLLKVTLRKAPQNFKENLPNTVPGPKGPLISLDMLRNVKLKSTRRRSLDQHNKSPRSLSRLTRNRSQVNLNLSPIALHAENSLGRMFKPVHDNKQPLEKR